MKAIRTKNEIKEIISNFQRNIEQELHMFYHYDWSKKFLKEMYEKHANYCDKITKEELLQFSILELQELGFNIWTKEDNPLLLIPLKLVAILDPHMNVESIFSKYEELRNTDKDVRLGCISYGIRKPCNHSVSVITQKKLDQIEMIGDN